MADSYSTLANEQITLVEKSWTLLSDENVCLAANGDSLHLKGQGKSTSVFIDATATTSITVGAACCVFGQIPDTPVSGISLQAGKVGEIRMTAGLSGVGTYVRFGPDWAKIQVGPDDAGAQLAMMPETVVLSVGLPGVGAEIRITPASITLKVGETIHKLTPASISELVGEVTREMTPQGSNFTSAETEFNVGVQGTTTSAPIETKEIEAARTENQTIQSQTTDAIGQRTSGIEDVD